MTVSRFSIFALAPLLIACSAPGQDAATESLRKVEAVAVVDGRTITVEDLGIKGELINFEQQIYQAKMEGLEKTIAELLIAKEASAKGVTSEELLEAEVESKVSEPTQAEIEGFYNQQRSRINQPLETVRAQIVRVLRQMQGSKAYDALVGRLRDEADVKVLIDSPKMAVDLSQAPLRGPDDAPVTIVEFSDFQCPFCRRVQPTLAELQDKYGDKLRWSFKDLPLVSIHPQARKAAEAARCAGDQGKFWEYRAAMFEAGGVSQELLASTADDIGLDSDAFGTCLESDKYRPAVDADMAEAESLGLTGTPAFLVNGVLLSGAQPLEAFSEVIDRELAKVAE